MRPTLRQLEYFVAVAEFGAFGPAADSLNVTQPSLSKQIAVLEQELGLQLFERTSRTVSLSAHGDALMADARNTLDAARAFRSRAERLSGDVKMRLQTGVLPSIGAYFLPRVRERLQSEFPGLRMSLVEGTSRDLLTRLNAGELDLVVASKSDLDGFEVLPLFEETLWVCSEVDDPIMKSDGPVQPAELRGREIFALSRDYYLTRIIQDIAQEAGAVLSEAYHGSSLDAIRQMATSGEGIAILPSLYALGEAIREPNFKVRRLDHSHASHPVFLYWRRTMRNQRLLQRLGAEMIAEKMAIRAERAEKFRQ
ncbi:LysR family transcriptional regulator [Maricaulis sp. D1M11]|uniref:LysR family transcriptional regulator n=1 Tax=Maricaulis sp. D1M11 TaxID=3076117 RepID=UPI0039B64A2E